MFIRTSPRTPESITRGDQIIVSGEIIDIQDVKVMKGNEPGTGTAYVAYDGTAHPVNLAARFAVVDPDGETSHWVEGA